MESSQTPRVVIIIQARMGSTRLPGKHLKTVLKRPLISFLIERLRRVKTAHQVVLATTTNPLDDQLVEFSKAEQLDYFRGSEEDVLERFYQCARYHSADVIVRVTADCPLIDPGVVDFVTHRFLQVYPTCDLASNVIKRTYPRGMDVEVFSFNSFQQLRQEVNTFEEREHVTPFYYHHSEQFHLMSLQRETDDSHYRWTVDTIEDFQLVSLILENLYPKTPFFTLRDLLELCHNHPEWNKINAHVQQKALGS